MTKRYAADIGASEATYDEYGALKTEPEKSSKPDTDTLHEFKLDPGDFVDFDFNPEPFPYNPVTTPENTSYADARGVTHPPYAFHGGEGQSFQAAKELAEIFSKEEIE